MGSAGNRGLQLAAGAPPRRMVAALGIVLILLVSSMSPAFTGASFVPLDSPRTPLVAQLENPQTIQLGTGGTETRLEPNQDYEIKLPAGPKTGYTMIEGGRNILINGGTIVMSGSGSELQRRAIYIKGATGTVRIQNVDITGSHNNAAFDAIAIAAPLAVVELVNIRVANLHGQAAGYHGDIVQPFGGVKKLVVNGLTGRTGYQGFYLVGTSGAIGAVELSNVNLSYYPNPHDASTVMIWFADCTSYPVTMQNVYIQPRPGQTLTRSVRPNGGSCAPTQSGKRLSWPQSSAIDGFITEGVGSGPPPLPDLPPGPGAETGGPVVRLSVPGRARAGGRVKLTAAAKDRQGVASVAFAVCKGTRCTWATARRLGVDTTRPFTTTWKAPKRGTYTFLARAIDGSGNVTTSPPKRVKVKAPSKSKSKSKSKR